MPSMDCRLRVVALFLGLLLLPLARAEDWPTYRHDRLRTAVSAEKLPPPLVNLWTFRARGAGLAPTNMPSSSDRAQPAARYDNKHGEYFELLPDQTRFALPITAAGDALFFTTAAGRIVCLDAATAQVRWEFLAGAGIAQTANVFDGRVYAGSDDGHVYCLDAQTGALIWKHRAVPSERWFLSFGRPSSKWPVRTDVLVADGAAYFAAGAFPHDGMYVTKVDAQNGARLWQTPYEGAGLSGALLVTALNVIPPVDLKGFNRYPRFYRSDGTFDVWSADPELKALFQDRAADSERGVVVDGVRHSSFEGCRTEGEHEAGKKQKLYTAPLPAERFPDARTFVYAGGTVYFLANDAGLWGVPIPGKFGGAVFARDPQTGSDLWSFAFPERPYHLIVARGRLFVSTRGGTIYAFAAAGTPARGKVEERIEAEPFARDEAWALAEKAAVAAENLGGLREGFAVVLDCDRGVLPYVLAERAGFYVCAVFEDAARAEAARALYERANLNASRIAVWHGGPGAQAPFPAKFADLVLSERAALGGALPADVEEVNRLLKPIRGTALLGRCQEKAAVESWTAAASAASSSSGGWTCLEAGGGWWAKRVRPPLEQAGGWTHPNGDPGNTMCSHDAALRGPLGVVWYGAPYVAGNVPSPPLLADGVLVCPTDPDTVEGWDQYNGRRLWRHGAPGIGTSMGRAVAGGETLYVNQDGTCLRFVLWTGERLGEVPPPIAGGPCAIAAVSADGRTLYGTAGGKDGQGEPWSAAFALDAATLKPRWTIGGPGQERQWGGWSAMSDGRMYFLGGGIKEGPQREQALGEVRAYLARTDPGAVEPFDKEAAQHDVRVLTAVDAATGKVLYERGIDITNCGGSWVPGAFYGSKRYANPMVGGCVMALDGCVVFCTQGDSDKGWPLWPGGGYGIRGIAVYDGADGKLLWKKACDYRARPVAMGGAIYAQPWAYDLRTGEKRTRANPVSGEPTPYAWGFPGKQCGILNASEHLIFGRNMGVGYHDVLRDAGTYTFMHSRPDCYVDTSSGGGMMIKPPMCLGCTCAWSLPFTIALAQADEEPEVPFAFYSPGLALPVKSLRLNFGEEGDRRDAAGNLWLAAERPGAKGYPARMQIDYAATLTWYPGVGERQRKVRRSAAHTAIANTDAPAVFATAVRGLRTCLIPIAAPGAAPRAYVVRLGFAALPGDQPGQRVFDVKLDGRTVLKRFDIVRECGAPDRAIWKEWTLTLGENLNLEFVAPPDEVGLDRLPLLSGAVILRK